MDQPILYSFRRCPFAMRARMALDAAEIKLEHREILLRDKPPSMLEASPKGTVPVLILPDQSVIDESLDIMVWALSQNDPDNWAASLEEDRESASSFLNNFKGHLDRYKYASRYDPDAARGSVDLDHRRQAMDCLSDFASTLGSTPFLRGDTPHFIDIATFPFVRQFAAVESDWWAGTAPDPLQSWLKYFLESERFKRIMKKHPLWSEADS